MKDCNCIKEIEAKIIANANQTSTDKEFKIVDSSFEHISWFPFRRLYSCYIIKSTYTKKDGSTSKPKNSHVNIFYTYCPFCGKKYN